MINEITFQHAPDPACERVPLPILPAHTTENFHDHTLKTHTYMYKPLISPVLSEPFPPSPWQVPHPATHTHTHTDERGRDREEEEEREDKKREGRVKEKEGHAITGVLQTDWWEALVASQLCLQGLQFFLQLFNFLSTQERTN